MTSASRAADLPTHSIVATPDDVWIKRETHGRDEPAWDSTGSRWLIDDCVIDRLFEVGATVLRYGVGQADEETPR